MNKKSIIRNFASFMLLMLFAISFVPKSFFHDIIASHTDTVSCEHPDKKEPCVHQKGFNCSFNDLVVSAPYLSHNISFSVLKPVIYFSYESNYIAPVLQHYSFGTESRGPPSTVA